MLRYYCPKKTSSHLPALRSAMKEFVGRLTEAHQLKDKLATNMSTLKPRHPPLYKLTYVEWVNGRIDDIVPIMEAYRSGN